jgi:PadR family transcriptional regulator PadR
MYGLEIINYIRKASSDTYILKQPTLYSALKRLEDKGFISSYWRDSAIGGRRHYYKLTDTGRNSLSVRKDQWSASKEVIDNLVEGTPVKKKSSKKPVLPVDDAPLAPATLPHTVTMGMPINPYNPFAESENDFLTLPFRILENASAEDIAVVTQQPVPISKDDEPLPLLKFAMAEATLAPVPIEPPAPVITQTVQIKQPTPQTVEVTSFARYLSPDDYAAITTVKTGAAAKTAKIANYDIQIRPFTKHFNDKKQGDFHFVGRLRFASAALITLLLIVGLVVAYHTLQPEVGYLPTEQGFFIAGYVLAGLYLAYYLVRLITSHASKKAVQSQTAEHFIRLGIFLGGVVAILAVNIIAIPQFDLTHYFVYWVVPSVLVATVYFEGVIQLLLRKTNIFVA